MPIKCVGPYVLAMLKSAWILNSRVSDNNVVGKMVCRRRLSSLSSKLGRGSVLENTGAVPWKLIRWLSREDGVSYAGSFFDSLLKKIGCLASEVCLFVPWMHRYLVLEVYATDQCIPLGSVLWNPSMWRTK